MAPLTRTEIDSEHYVARYARGGLTDSQREAFEEYCLLHPEVAEQVATDRALISGLRDIEARPATRAPRPVFRYALAAGVAALFVMAGTLAYLNLFASAPISLLAAASDLPARIQSAPSSRVRITMTRGSRPIELSVAPSVRTLQLAFDPGLSGATQFDFTLVEHTAGGDVERGRVRQSLQEVDGEAVAPLVIDLGTSRESNLRLDVVHGDARESFELRVVRK
jgi:hypothetical protein